MQKIPSRYTWNNTYIAGTFPIHEIGRIDGGRGFWTGGNVFWIGRNTFYDQKNEILMKIPEFKRSGIGIITEFRRIPSRFPNQAWGRCPKMDTWLMSSFKPTLRWQRRCVIGSHPTLIPVCQVLPAMSHADKCNGMNWQTTKPREMPAS
jgi:hypothetical protein